MATVQFDRVTRRYPGRARPAVDALDLDVDDGELLVLVGPPGSGKSTSLRMLAGLEEVDEGAIRVDGRDVTGVEAKDRDVATVFQNYALYPHMTVAENMGFALRIAGSEPSEIARRVADAAKVLDLVEQLDRTPRGLTGAQRQRVAMGRAIVRDPKVFLMDEPLANLDAELRLQTRAQISSLQKNLGTTTVYVTHDQVEAMTMGDRVAVLSDGVLQQVGTPRELYDRPANLFVAGYVGAPPMNLLEMPLAEAGATWGSGTLPLARETLAAGAQEPRGLVTVGLRPEALVLASGSEPASALTMSVELVEAMGADAYVYGAVEVDGRSQYVVARVDARHAPTAGGTVAVLPRSPEDVHVFSPTTGARLSA